MQEEILVCADMRCEMVQEWATLFGTYRKIVDLVNGRVAYRHKDMGVDSYLWYHPDAGWLIGCKQILGTDLAYLYGQTHSLFPVSPICWNVRYNGKWTACENITISSTSNSIRGHDVNYGHGNLKSVRLGTNKGDSINISGNEGNYEAEEKTVSDMHERVKHRDSFSA
jgi:hypothetical protein